jgi:hypothetical protein
MQITAMKSVLLSSYLLFWGIVAVLTPGVLGNDGCTSGCTTYVGNTDLSSCTSNCTTYASNADMSSCKSDCTSLGANTNMSLCTSNCTTVGKDADMSSCTSDCKAYGAYADMSLCTKNCSCEISCNMTSCVADESKNCERTQNWWFKDVLPYDNVYKKIIVPWGNFSCESHCRYIGGSFYSEGYPVIDECENHCMVQGESKNQLLTGCKHDCLARDSPRVDMSLCTENCTANGGDMIDMSSCTKNCQCMQDCDMSSCVGGPENCRCYTGNCGPKDYNYSYSDVGKNYSEVGYIIAIVIGVLFLVGMFFYQKRKRGEEEKRQKDENKPVFPVAAQPVSTQQQYTPVAVQAPVPPQPQAPVVPVPYQEADIVVNSS